MFLQNKNTISGTQNHQRPLRFLHTPSNQRQSSLRSTLDESPGKQFVLKKHKRYNSCQNTLPTPGVVVKRELLRQKRHEPLKSIQKLKRLKIKQKTDCYNFEYLSLLKERSSAIDWVKFNIMYGIYQLWNRIKGAFSEEDKVFGDIKKLIEKTSKMQELVQKMIKPFSMAEPDLKEAQIQRISSSLYHQGEPNSAKLRNNIKQKKGILSTFHNSSETKQNEFNPFFTKQSVNRTSNKFKIDQIFLQNSEIASKDNQISFAEIQTFLSELENCHKTVSILEHKINVQIELQKQKKPLNKQRIKQLQNLNKKLKSHKERFAMINDYTQKLEFILKNRDKIQLTIQQIKTIEQALQNINKTKIKQKNVEEEKKMFETISHIFQNITKSTIKHLSPNQTRKNLTKKALESKKEHYNQTKKVRIKANNRASIELRIDGGNTKSSNFMNTYYNTPANTSNLRTQTNSKHKILSQKQTKGIKTSNQINSSNSNSVKATLKKIPSRRNSKVREEGKKKKTLLFLDTSQSEGIQLKRKMSSGRKLRTKSKKDGSKSSIACKSFRSLHGVDTFNILQSSSGINMVEDIQPFKSFRDEREIQYLKGKLKKISCIRNYRCILFKLAEQFGVPSLEFKKEVFNETMVDFYKPEETQILQISKVASIIPSIKELEENQDDVEQKIQSFSNSKGLIRFNKRNLNKIIKKAQHFIPRKNVRSNCVTEHNDERQNIIRQFLIKYKQIEKQNNITKKKGLLNQYIEILYYNNAISKESYEEYKIFLKKNEKQEQKPENGGQSTENIKASNLSPFSCLVQLQKQISTNKLLNQTNKYYYRFNQFKAEEEQINKTKKNRVREEEFFNIKTSIQVKKLRKKMKIKTEESVTVQDNLFQKGM